MSYAVRDQASLHSLGYSVDDLRRIGPLEQLEDVAGCLARYGYDGHWRENYRVRSLRASLEASTLTCIDAAVLAYGLLDFFPEIERWLLAIHRRGDGEECGHVATLYRHDGRFGAFSFSSFDGLGHRVAVFPDEHAVACSFAQAYVRMGFTPLFYGTVKLEEVAGNDLDWRFGVEDITQLSARIVARYAYAFDVAPREVST